MSLHLVKLCVGAESIADLEAWIAERRRARRRGTIEPADHIHTTRMFPRRAPELIDGGSLYWVIKGQIAARQAILSVTAVTAADGTAKCEIGLDPAVVPILPRPCRPFQGWRYLEGADCPVDLGVAQGDFSVMPEALRRELADLGLL